LLVGAVLLFTGLVATQYYQRNFSLYNQAQKPLKSPDQAKKVLQGWEEFSNKDVGLSFEYPKNWTVNFEVSGYLGKSVRIANPTGSVVINVSENKLPYGFSASDDKITRTPQDLYIGDKNVKTDMIEGSTTILEDFSVNNYQFLIGTGYPAGEDKQASKDDFNSAYKDIMYILSTLKFTN
jgi:hypothetical protein